MNVREEKHDQVMLLAPEGRLDSNTSPSFEQLLMGRIGDGSNRVVVDLSDLDYISSAGLRVLLMAAKRAQEGKGALALCGMKSHIRDVFDVSGFLPVLTVVEDSQAAIAAASG